MKPNILIIATGGTIAMTQDGQSGIVPALSAQDLMASVPGLADVAAVEPISLFRKPGASLTLQDLVRIVETLEDDASSVFDGVVIVQGTDTIEETAFALDCLLDPRRPVVVTGAMRGPQQAGADGPANLLASVIVAGSGEILPGVVVVLNDEVHAARHVRKGHTGLTSSFISTPFGPIGHVSEGQFFKLFTATPMPLVGRPTGKIPEVAHIAVTMGDDGRVMDALGGLGYEGAVLCAMGAGHVPHGMVSRIETLAKTMPVILSTRVGGGTVFTSTYGFEGSEMDLLARGVTAGGAIGPLKARILLQLLLACEAKKPEIASIFGSL